MEAMREKIIKQPVEELEQRLAGRLNAQMLLRFISSLRAKLIVPYVLLTLVIAMVGVYVVTRLVTSSIRERFVNQLFEASRVASDGLVRRERVHLVDLRLMAFTDGVPQAVESLDVDSLKAMLLPLAMNNKTEAVTIINLEGKEILTLAVDPSTGLYLESHGGDFSGFSMVTKVLEGKADELGDKFADILRTTYGAYLFTSAPIRTSSGDLVGAVLIGTRMETLLGELKNQALADMVLLDNSGKLVATTLVMPEEGPEVLEEDPSILEGAEGTETIDLKLYGRDYQAAVAPLIIRQQEMGILKVVLPSNYIVSTIATSRNVFSLIFSLGTVATIIIGYLLAQSIAKPILRLRNISQAVAAGDLEQTTGLRGSDEIGELASAFDTMTGRLRERTAEAARLYAETVRRNEELADANARLQSAQAQLVQSEKLASVGQLTAGIVHDVKNPLAVIKGLAEELHEELGLDRTTKNQLKTIRDSASQASTIVGDLLKFARQSTPELSRRDIRETIESSLRLTEYLTRKGGVDVMLDMPKENVIVTYDATQIEQVLINLITNAVQAMPNGGTLRVNLGKAEKAVAIAVMDTGMGIPRENLSRIFDPFFTTKDESEGTGLGLSVSYGIVSRHGGRIEVESKVGRGTTFTVLLPVVPTVSEGERTG
ncbi:MAG: HAMP domain-containing protein [Anaerolineales bacterium]|nr:HAMP domain-containing protein [Anaerolineales bacterium]